MFTVHRMRVDGSLTDKEHLNNFDELSVWLYKAHEVKHWSKVRIEHDERGIWKVAQDVGTRYEIIEEGRRGYA